MPASIPAHRPRPPGLKPRAKHWLLESGSYRLFRSVLPSRELGILRYHAVADPAACWYASPGICLSPSDFERHAQYLAANYRVLPLPDAVEALQRDRTLPRNAVAITFDDGYADNLEAARILHRSGLTATFYLTAGCLCGGQPFWPSELRHLLARIDAPSVELTAGGRRVTVTPGKELGALNQAASAVGRLFKSVPISERERLRDQLRRMADAPEAPSPMLTWDQVREMRDLGMTIGSHTMTHPNLPSAGLDEARREIVAARDRLAAETGAAITMFSYPNGGAERYFSDELQTIVRDAGHTAATTSVNGIATRRSNVYALERVRVVPDLAEQIFALEIERFWFKPRGARPPSN
jgi:peptidoglycan/xylan/chitin deacetylase (PgdA/CDA1 family)